MMKKFIASGAFSKCGKPGGDLGGKGAMPIPKEVEVMTTFSWPHLRPRNATWLVEPRVPNSLQ
jgi:hypothetical protein